MPQKLTDPERRLQRASSLGGYKQGALLALRTGRGGFGYVTHFGRDRAREEYDACFGERAERLADRESFEHRFD